MIYGIESDHVPGTILVVGEDKKLHQARITIRKRNCVDAYNVGRIRKYLYLSYRDGKTVRQKYLGKLV